MRSAGHLRGRVGVITGAESAAGTDVARALAAEGMSLMLIAQPGAHVRALAEELTDAHDIRCFPASLDVTDPAAVDRIVMHAEQHIGAVDVLVNTILGAMTAALEPTMVQRGRGTIINIDPAPFGSSASAAVVVANLTVEESPIAAAALSALLPT